MKSDLENLLITTQQQMDIIDIDDLAGENSLKRFSSIIIRPSTIKEYNEVGKKKSQGNIIIWFGVISLIFWSIFPIIEIESLAACLIIGYPLSIWAIIYGIKNNKKMNERFKEPNRLGVLLDEVDKYNKIIRHLDTSEQLQEIGQGQGIVNREEVFSALKTMQKDLIRSLKTDKILRDNPDFRPEAIVSESIPILETFKFDKEAIEIESLVQEAIEIGLKVQEEMRAL